MRPHQPTQNRAQRRAAAKQQRRQRPRGAMPLAAGTIALVAGATVIGPAAANAGVIVNDQLVVSTLSESGAGSLRDMVEKSNNYAGSQTISFAEGLAGAINLSTEVPTGPRVDYLGNPTGGYYYATEGVNPLYIADSVTIVGNGAVTITGGDATETAMEIEGGLNTFAPEGDPQLIVPSEIGIDVNISNLTITNTTETAITANNTDLSLTNVTVSNSGNRGDDGGALNVNNSTVTIVDSTFTDNEGYYGGAIKADDSDVSVSGSLFTGNEASYGGGAIAIYDSGDLTITESAFYDNIAGDSGGAIAVQTPYSVQTPYNSSPGASELPESTVTIQSSTLSGNEAGNDGGALYANGDVQVTIQDSEISGNTAYGGGGGLYVDIKRPLTITGSEVSGNSAPNGSGGGIYVGSNYGASVTISDTLVADNSADSYGGGLFADDDVAVTITNSVIRDNTSNSGDGGGIRIDGGSADVSIVNSLISGNRAGETGGGIDVGNIETSLEIVGSTISGNISTSGGTGLHVNDAEGNITITDTSVVDNSLNPGRSRLEAGVEPIVAYSTDGAAVEITDSYYGSFSFDNVTIVNNEGGGLDVEGNYLSVNVTDSIIAGNDREDEFEGFSVSGLDLSGEYLSVESSIVGTYEVEEGVPQFSDEGGNQLGVDPEIIMMDGALAGEVGERVSGEVVPWPTLKSTSPAIDASTLDADDREHDVRGLPRTAGLSQDLGSVEMDFGTVTVNTSTLTVSEGSDIVVEVTTEPGFDGTGSVSPKFFDGTGSAKDDVSWGNSHTIAEEAETIDVTLGKALADDDHEESETVSARLYGKGVTNTSSDTTVTIDNVNTAPTISTIDNQTVELSTATGDLAFTIDDDEQDVDKLTVTASSSDTSVVADTGITIGGSTGSRTVNVTPVTGVSGSAAITLTVSDGKLTASTTFTVTVKPASVTPPAEEPKPEAPVGKEVNGNPINGNVSTNDSTPTVSGTGQPGATLEVGLRVNTASTAGGYKYAPGDSAVCTTVVASDGTWSCTFPVAIPAGSYTVSIRQVANGVTSEASSFTLSISAGVLPETGGNPWNLGVWGAALLSAGTALSTVGRRRRRPTTES